MPAPGKVQRVAWCYHVAGVALRPSRRGRGIGASPGGGAGRATGAGCLGLSCFEQDEGARRFHDRLGYRVVARAAVVPEPMIR